jgi:hypothetical protein
MPTTPENPGIDEIGGAGLVGLTLGMGILAMLESKRLITPQEIERLLEAALIGLESLQPPNNPAVRFARAFVEEQAQAMALRRTRNPTQS